MRYCFKRIMKSSCCTAAHNVLGECSFGITYRKLNWKGQCRTAARLRDAKEVYDDRYVKRGLAMYSSVAIDVRLFSL